MTYRSMTDYEFACWFEQMVWEHKCDQKYVPIDACAEAADRFLSIINRMRHIRAIAEEAGNE